LRLRFRVSAICRVKELLPFRRACHEQIGEVDRQKTVRLLGDQFHRHIVDLARGHKRRHARSGDADLARVELRRILLQYLLDIPHHGIGIERRAVVEFNAGAELECPLGLVGIVDLPFARKARDQDARLVGGREVPHGERVIHSEAGEAVALKALVRLAQRARNVGRRHADAKGGLGEGGLRQAHRQPGRQHNGDSYFFRFFGTHQNEPLFNFM
jgi:hypothetical protein